MTSHNRLYHSLPHLFSHTLMPSAAFHSDTTHLAHTSVARELNQYAEKIEYLSAAYLAKLTTILVRLKYDELSAIPWLQRDTHRAYVQLVHNDNLQSKTDDIWQSFAGQTLLHQISLKCSEFSNLQVVQTLQSMMYLGCDYTLFSFQRLWSECTRRIPTLNISELVIVSKTIRDLYANPAALSVIVRRFADIYEDIRKAWSPDLARDVIDVSLKCGRIFSQDLWQKYADLILSGTNEENFMTSPKCIVAHLNFAQSLLQKTVSKNFENVHFVLIENAIRASQQQAQHMDSRDIGEICTLLRGFHSYRESTSQPFVRQSMILLDDEDCKLSDVVNVTSSLHRNTPLFKKRKFENALLKHLADSDPFILSKLCVTVTRTNIQNKRLHDRLQDEIVRNAKGIFRYSKGFIEIIRFLSITEFVKKSNQDRFNALLYSHMQGNQSRNLSHQYLSCVASYLLQQPNPKISKSVLENIIISLPSWTIPSLNRLGIGMLGKWSMPSSVGSNLPPNVTEVMNWDMLSKLKSGLYDTMLTNSLQYTQNLTITKLGTLTRLLHTLEFYIEPLYDELGNYIIENRHALLAHKEFHSSNVYLSACARVGFIPSRLNEFVETMELFVESANRHKRPDIMLELTLNMCIIGAFPEKSLVSLFDMEYLSNLDEFMKRNPGQKDNIVIEDQLMKLNRCVVLEQPQLMVPWFHDEYHTQQALSGKHNPSISTKTAALEDDLHLTLCQILQTHKLQRSVRTPYYYCINFAHTSSNSIDPVKQKYNIKEERVAFLTLTDDSFCFNSTQMKGIEQMRKRHLEIMGYRVIPINLSEWGSFQEIDRLTYLREKIFS